VTFEPKVGVVGCGLMGSEIAQVCAAWGLDVVVVEADSESLKAGQGRVEASLAQAVRRGKLSEEAEASARAGIRFATDAEILADRVLVVEAVPEIAALKVDTFRRIDAVVQDADAVLASNTSSVPIIELARATGRPDRVIGIHFFNPVPVLPLIEIVPSLMTAPEVVDAATDFASKTLGKNVIRSADRAGFIVNGLLIPYLLSAIRMLESAVATADDIDAGMVHGCAHPMGPLALADLIGLDTVAAIAESMYEEFKEPLYAPPPLLRRMVSAGLLGRKVGRGFHQYP
jgi:3-hydroxybutyryl-CoA dehydrogenase